MARQLDYTVVYGTTVYPQGEDVPDEVWNAIHNPATSGQPADEAPRPTRADKKDVWAAYAAAHGVTVDDDATKDEIVAAVDAAGV